MLAKAASLSGHQPSRPYRPGRQAKRPVTSASVVAVGLKAVFVVRLSRATLANIHQNVAVALGLKVVFVVTTLAGVTGLWPAVLADTGATVLVTLNALRLRRWRPMPSRPTRVSNRDENR